jgi:hypothetical protein
MMTKPLENRNQKYVSNNKGPVPTNSLKVFSSNSEFKQLNSEGKLSSAPQDEKLEPRGAKRARSQSLTEQESASKSAKKLKLRCKAPGRSFFRRAGEALDTCFGGARGAPTSSRVTTE